MVLGDDSDFLLFREAEYVRLTDLDQLVKNGVVAVFSRERVAEKLGLSERSLVDMALLLGNDYTGHLTSDAFDAQSLEGLSGSKPWRCEEVLKWLLSRSETPARRDEADSDGGSDDGGCDEQRVCAASLEADEAFRFSRALSDLGTASIIVCVFFSSKLESARAPRSRAVCAGKTRALRRVQKTSTCFERYTRVQRRRV